MKKLSIPFIFLISFLVSCEKEMTPQLMNGTKNSNAKTQGYLPAGAVQLGYSKASTGVFLGSPSITIAPNGNLLAIYELNGATAARTSTGETITKVLRSSDSGKTWNKLNDINGQMMSTVFVHNNELYIIGLEKYKGNVRIRKSTNNGTSWSTPVTIRTGEHHGASTPIVNANGRLWRAVETVETNSTIWPQYIKPYMMSIKNTDNLLDPAKWTTTTNGLNYNSTYWNGYFRGWLEGNAVLGPNNQMKLVLRVFDWSKVDEKIAVADVNSSVVNNVFSSTLSFTDPTGFKIMPGGQKKFTIRYDSESGRYLTLSNYIPQAQLDKLALEPASSNYKAVSDVRNTLALCSSADLSTWQVDKILIEDPDYYKHGFQYADWVLSGSNIYAVVRTADDDASGGADNHHNANYITFHKFTK